MGWLLDTLYEAGHAVVIIGLLNLYFPMRWS